MPSDTKITCDLDICYWNLGLELRPDNCACKIVHISHGKINIYSPECLSFISKSEAEKRLNKVFNIQPQST